MSESTTNRAASEPAQPLKRRGLLLGAGAAGAAVARRQGRCRACACRRAGAPRPPPRRADPAGGYRLTDHVLRYYATTRALTPRPRAPCC